jgi:hypothetical protein
LKVSAVTAFISCNTALDTVGAADTSCDEFMEAFMEAFMVAMRVERRTAAMG